MIWNREPWSHMRPVKFICEIFEASNSFQKLLQDPLNRIIGDKNVYELCQDRKLKKSQLITPPRPTISQVWSCYKLSGAQWAQVVGGKGWEEWAHRPLPPIFSVEIKLSNTSHKHFYRQYCNWKILRYLDHF